MDLRDTAIFMIEASAMVGDHFCEFAENAGHARLAGHQWLDWLAVQQTSVIV
ncbi:MAG: hypothetical protein WAJ87_15115 [Bryobacteraceae bacterium]